MNLLRKRSFSLLTALMLVISLFALLPEGALKAKAASKLNIRTSYNAETGKLTVTWTRYNDTCGYTIHYYNESAEQPGQYLEMPDLSPSYPNLNGPASYTTSDYFGQAYGNGGKKYKIYIVCSDISGTLYSEFSEPFETGTTILPTPENPTFCENGLIFWNDDWDKYTDLSMYNFKTNNRVTSSTTQSNYTQYLIDNMTQGEYYYATIQNIARGDYRYRYSKKVTTNTVQYKGKTGVLGAYWEGSKLCWIRYPGAASYKMDMQIDLLGTNSYSTVATDIPSASMAEYSKVPLLKMEMKKYLCQIPSGTKIRFAITALDSNGNAISNTTNTAPTTYKSRLVGDLNGDGKISADDAIIAARLAASYGDYASRYSSDVADMNRDGEVTADDAIIIARYAANYGDYRTRYTKYI